MDLCPLLPKSLVIHDTTSGHRRKLIRGVGAGPIRKGSVNVYGSANSVMRIEVMQDDENTAARKEQERVASRALRVCDRLVDALDDKILYLYMTN